jgi:hypothetical protein
MDASQSGGGGITIVRNGSATPLPKPGRSRDLHLVTTNILDFVQVFPEPKLADLAVRRGIRKI